jgi:hypothetical protein
MAYDWIPVEKAASEALRGARRLVDLKVNEVSVVDRPAIQREFLVTKNMEEMMTLTQQEIDQNAAQVSKALADAGFAAIEKELPDELKKDTAAVVPLLRKLAGQAEGETKRALMNVAAKLEAESKGKQFAPKAEDDPKPDDKEGKEAAGEPGGGGAGGGGDDELGPDGKPKKPVPPGFGKTEDGKEKALSLDGGDHGTVIKIGEDGSVHVLSKGVKGFTSARTESLKQAAVNMMGLLQDADEATYKSALEQLIGKELPSNTKLPSAVRPTGTGAAPGGTRVSKSDDSATAILLADLKKSMDAQNERLDAIEKARSPSTQPGGDGGTPPKKVEKSMWGSIL